METQSDTIFVTGLPKDVTSQEIETHFKLIGNIKFDKGKREPKIWIYKDKETGEGKGEATITFEDESYASMAIDCFNGKPFLNTQDIIQVSLSQRKIWSGPGQGRDLNGYESNYGRNDGRGGYPGMRGRGRGRGPFIPKEGDWNCFDCGNINFAKRFECNRCGKPKPEQRTQASYNGPPIVYNGRGRGGGRYDDQGYRGGYDDGFDKRPGGRRPPPERYYEPSPGRNRAAYGGVPASGSGSMRDGDWICPDPKYWPLEGAVIVITRYFLLFFIGVKITTLQNA
jgi:RNA-binding protein FUS